MSRERPTPIELQFQAQSLQRTGARLEQTILLNGQLQARIEALSTENGRLRLQLRSARYTLIWLCVGTLLFFLVYNFWR